MSKKTQVILDSHNEFCAMHPNWRKSPDAHQARLRAEAVRIMSACSHNPVTDCREIDRTTWRTFYGQIPMANSYYTGITRGVQMSAHKVLYEYVTGQHYEWQNNTGRGKQANGLILWRMCGNVSCVNPEHMYVGAEPDPMVTLDFWRDVQATLAHGIRTGTITEEMARTFIAVKIAGQSHKDLKMTWRKFMAWCAD